MKFRRKNVALAAAMARKGLNGQDLAELAKVHPLTISRLLNMRQAPHPTTANAIADAVGVPGDELFSESRSCR